MAILRHQKAGYNKDEWGGGSNVTKSFNILLILGQHFSHFTKFDFPLKLTIDPHRYLKTY